MTAFTRRDALSLVGGLATLAVVRTGSADDPLPTAAVCSAERLAALLAEVAKARAGVTTLEGPFTQERTIGLLSAKVRSTGTLTLVRPDRLRWELAPPDDVVYWVTPEGLAYKSPTGQGRVPAASQKATAALADLRVLLGGDLSELRERYDLTGTCPDRGAFTLHAAPKAGVVAPFKEVALTLAADRVSPEAVTIVEGPRDRTEIRFGTLRVNGPVPAARMTPGAP